VARKLFSYGKTSPSRGHGVAPHSCRQFRDLLFFHVLFFPFLHFIFSFAAFMGKLRAGEERLRMTENILRQVRHYVDDRFGSKSGNSPRSRYRFLSLVFLNFE
jgi:hypothetical protein